MECVKIAEDIGTNFKYFFILSNFSDDVTVDPEPSWRQAFLIERGKMTEDRFAKIRHTISHLANHSMAINGSALGHVPYRRLSRQELLAIECVKPKFQNPCQPDQVKYSLRNLIRR